MQYKINDIVIYCNYGICRIKEIRFTSFSSDRPKEEYFVLSSQDNKKSTCFVPVSSADSILRYPMSEAEIESLLEQARNAHIEWPENRQRRFELFNKILSEGISVNLILLLGCLYNKRLENAAKNKTLSATDEQIFSQAEKLLHNEFAYSLKLPTDKVSTFISDCLNK